jgi:hypothetical protein
LLSGADIDCPVNNSIISKATNAENILLACFISFFPFLV